MQIKSIYKREKIRRERGLMSTESLPYARQSSGILPMYIILPSYIIPKHSEGYERVPFVLSHICLTFSHPNPFLNCNNVTKLYGLPPATPCPHSLLHISTMRCKVSDMDHQELKSTTPQHMFTPLSAYLCFVQPC